VLELDLSFKAFVISDMQNHILYIVLLLLRKSLECNCDEEIEARFF
jgi:hypothetical protein